MNLEIKVIEDAIKAKIAAVVAYLPLTKIKTIPADTDLATLEGQMLPMLPVAMVGWDGFELDASKTERFEDGIIWHEIYTWEIFLAVKSLRSMEQSLRGDSVVEGAYDVVTDVVAALQGELLLVNTNPVVVTKAQLLLKKPAIVIYHVIMTCGQDRNKTLTPCEA